MKFKINTHFVRSLQPLLFVKMTSKVRHWKDRGLIFLWRYQGALQVLPVQNNLVTKLAKNEEFWIFDLHNSSFHYYSSGIGHICDKPQVFSQSPHPVYHLAARDLAWHQPSELENKP